MRFGLYVAPFGPLADPEALAEAAARAEDAGWDGLFLWDHVMTDEGVAVADPWIALAAIAVATERLRLGPLVTPLPRRRPWDVARQAATLDRLSGGRVVLGVGIGGDGRRELSAFGEERDARARAALLDEALEVVTALWTGEPLTHAGPGWRLDRAQVLPTPVQTPRVPIWGACVWPNRAPLRRAARLDGVFPVSHEGPMNGEDVRAMLAVVAEHRPADAGPYDVVLTGHGPPDRRHVAELQEAGVTWWLQGFGDRPGPQDLNAAAVAGPPS